MKNTKAFSLMEIMVVITIIAFLIAAAIPSYVSYLRRASLTEAVTVLGEYRTAIGVFWSTQGRLIQAGDILVSTPADLPFETVVTENLPKTIQSLTLSSSGNGNLITLVIGSGPFSTEAENNRTLVLGVKAVGREINFECGNFTTDATAATDIGFVSTINLPRGCDYNGVGEWLATD